MSTPDTTRAIGEVRTLPDDHEEELPVAKKPRTDAKRGKKGEKGKRGRKKFKIAEKYSADDVLWHDIVSVLGKEVVDQALKEGTEFDSPYECNDDLKVKIVGLSSSGEAIGLAVNDKNRPWAIVTQFCLPGEVVLAQIYKNGRLHSFASTRHIAPNLDLRDDSRVKCQYFGRCGGCQYQMLSYEQQLKIKRDVIVNAYKNFSDLPESAIPIIQNTVPSPLQYGYRTKISPHFRGISKEHARKKAIVKDGVVEKPEWLNIGFNKAGRHEVLDIEECPIATPVINNALPSVREKIFRTIHTYDLGASLILRDSLRMPISEPSKLASSPPSPSSITTTDPVDVLSSSLEEHVCITNHNDTVRERVGDMLFEYSANSFFQNNNSILLPLTEYVRDAIHSSPSSSFTSLTSPAPRMTHLVDAYCGAGLFSIMLSHYFDKIAGIELSAESIKAARHNASLNGIPPSKISFRVGDAANIFASVERDFVPSNTVLVIDPPRKGCDENFIKQVLEFGCAMIVYVSCNVHTQARDVGMLARGLQEDGKGRRYVVESLRGFDLFPQTAHVESVAVLRVVV